MSVIRDGYTAAFVIEQERPDGTLLLRPQDSLEDAHRQHGGQRLTSAEYDELVAPFLGPADDEA